LRALGLPGLVEFENAEEADEGINVVVQHLLGTADSSIGLSDYSIYQRSNK